MKRLKKIIKKQNLILIKENVRKIKNNRKVFISTLIIIAITISLYSTLLILEKNLNKITKTTYDEKNIMDILVSSNIPFSYNNINSLDDIKEINNIETIKEIKSYVEVKNKKHQLIITNINEKPINDNKNYINKLSLIYGKFPQTINEGLIDDSFFRKNNLALGDLVTISLNDESMLRAKKIRIVGTVKQEYQTSNKSYLYIQPNNFNYDFYNKIYITLKDTYNLNNKDYLSITDKNKEEIKKSLKEPFEKRRLEYIKELDSKIEYVKNYLEKLYKSETPQESMNEQLSIYTNYLASLETSKNDANKIRLKVESRNDVSSYQDKILIINKFKNFLIIVCIFTIIYICLSIFKIIYKDKKNIATLLINNYNIFKLSSKYFSFVFIEITLAFIISKILFKPIYFVLLKLVFNLKNIPLNIELCYFVKMYLLLLFIGILTIISTFNYILNKSSFIILKNIVVVKKRKILKKRIH